MRINTQEIVRTTNLNWERYFIDLYGVAKVIIFNNPSITHKDLQKKLNVDDYLIQRIQERFSKDYPDKRIKKLKD